MKNAFVLDVCDDIKKSKNKKIVIFGTGEYGIITFLKLLELNVFVHYFCDTFDSSLGKIIMNKKVISFEALQSIKDECVIIIASMYYKKIYENLTKLGFNNVFCDLTHITVGKNIDDYKTNDL